MLGFVPAFSVMVYRYVPGSVYLMESKVIVPAPPLLVFSAVSSPAFLSSKVKFSLLPPLPSSTLFILSTALVSPGASYLFVKVFLPAVSVVSLSTYLYVTVATSSLAVVLFTTLTVATTVPSSHLMLGS